MTFFSGGVLAPVAFIVLTEAGPLSADAQACIVAGGEITLDADAGVTVHPPGEDPFGLRWVETEHIKATIPAKPGEGTPIRVRNAISFDATAGSLWYDVARTAQTSGGMVKLYRGARLADARATGNDVVGAVVMNDDSGVPSEPAITAAPVRVPCSAITLGVETDEFEGRIAGDGTWWQTRGFPARIELHARPDQSSAAVVVAAHAGSRVPLVFARLEVRGSWMRVGRNAAYAVITGWTPVPDLDQASRPPDGEGGGPRRGPGLWGHGRRAKPPFYEGPAHIAVGTRIYAEPGRGAWARVESGGDLFKIAYDEGATWAEVIEIPGVLGPEIRAYVPVSATRHAR
jgi:hypothetical protein